MTNPVKSPDQITNLAHRGANLDKRAMEAMSAFPGEKAVPVSQMAAHYIMMNYEQRTILFRELIVMHGPVEGLKLMKSIYQIAQGTLAGSPLPPSVPTAPTPAPQPLDPAAPAPSTQVAGDPLNPTPSPNNPVPNQGGI
jgi:hypothetical protein